MDPLKLEAQAAGTKVANGTQESEIPNKLTLRNKLSVAIKKKTNNCCSEKSIKKRLPFLEWIPKYSTEDLIGDLIAGMTVALATIPQCIAYSILADLAPIYGLYASFIGVFIYAIFGSSRVVNVGPSAVTSLLAFDYAGGNPTIAIFLAFVSGCVLLMSSILDLGFIISFVSKPVFSGFVSGAAIAIMSSQIKLWFGIKMKPRTLVDTYVQFFNHFGETHWNDFWLGLVVMVFLLIMKFVKGIKKFQPTEDDTPKESKVKKIIFLLCSSSNAIAVIITTIMTLMLDANQPFSITGEIAQGLPKIHMIPFSMNNGTTDIWGMFEMLGIGIVLMPLITLVEAVAIADAFGGGKALDIRQEMFAIGLSNVAGSFLQGYPITASFSRSAINASSGVRTQGSGILVGSLVIAAVVVLTPYFKYIPLATLAGVVIISVGYMIEYEEIMKVWKVRKIDQISMWATFLVCILWKLQYGIVIGMIVNMCVLLYGSLYPEIKVMHVLEELHVPPHIIVAPRTQPHYVSMSFLREKLRKVAVTTGKGIYPVVLDCYHFSSIDYSCALGLNNTNNDFKCRSQPFFLVNVNRKVKEGLMSVNPNLEIVQSEDLIDIIFKLDQREDANGSIQMKPVEPYTIPL